jgi:hypothetical protein
MMMMMCLIKNQYYQIRFKPKIKQVMTKSNLDNNYNSNLKLKDDSQRQNKIPFISDISHYLSQKKKEYKKLENYK